MRFSVTLGLYLGRQTLLGIGTVFLVLAGLLITVDMVELGRRAVRDDDAEFSLVVRMALLHLPYLAQRALPYAVLVGGLLSLARLSRTNEIAVVGAAGVSTPQLLFPAVAVAFALGTFSVAMLSPLASATLARYYELDNEYLRERAARPVTLRNGLWLRQADDTGSAIVHAAAIDPDRATLRDVLVVRFGEEDRFVERIDAAAADMRDGHWLLRDVLVSGPGHRSGRIAAWRLDTDLTIERLQNSFAAPETLSFWEIPEFVDRLERIGFSALRHRLYWHSMAASPFFYAGMILIAALFSMRAVPRGRTGRTLALGAACGFGFYVFSDVATAYGLNGQLPYALAAWAPAAFAVLLGSGLLLHLRRG